MSRCVACGATVRCNCSMAGAPEPKGPACHLVTLMAVTTCWNRHHARALARELGLSRAQFRILLANDTDDEADSEAIAAAKRSLSGRAHLEAALERVESASIRAWAREPHNRRLLTHYAAISLEKARPGGVADVHMFAAFIVASAIGL